MFLLSSKADILGFHGGEFVDVGRLGCDAVFICRGTYCLCL